MEKILVGFDGSDGAKQALMKAKHIVAGDGEIILLAVLPRPEDKTFLDENMYKNIRSKAKQLIADAVKELGDHTYTVTPVIEKGDPASTIIDQANKLGCDLIMLGSTGTSAFGRYLLGSVANKVVQYAHKPVMVVR